MLNQAPNLYTLEQLAKTVNGPTQAGLPNGLWVPARPQGFHSVGNRIRCAWAVFTGRADAVTWPGQPDVVERPRCPRTALRWGDNDRYLGPFTYARERGSHRSFCIELGTGYHEDERCRLRLAAGRHTLIVALPPIVKPERKWVDTSRHEWSSAPGGYWDSHQRTYGVSLHEGLLSIRYGRQTMDSSTEQTWSKFLPWTQWRFVGHRLYGLDGKLFAVLPHRARWDSPERAEQERLTEACPTAMFAFKDFDGEGLTVTTKIEERQWAFGEGWFKWLSVFRRPKISRSLDLRFSGETGKRKGSWKGGTLGHGIEMLPGELHAEAFERYCAENAMTYGGPLQ
jgi:hypothetical protein